MERLPWAVPCTICPGLCSRRGAAELVAAVSSPADGCQSLQGSLNCAQRFAAPLAGTAADHAAAVQDVSCCFLDASVDVLVLGCYGANPLH